MTEDMLALITILSGFGGAVLGGLLFQLLLALHCRGRDHLCPACGYTFSRKPGHCKKCARSI